MASGQGQAGPPRAMSGQRGGGEQQKQQQRPGLEAGGRSSSTTQWSAGELLSQRHQTDAAEQASPSKPLNVGGSRLQQQQHERDQDSTSSGPSTSLSISPMTTRRVESHLPVARASEDHGSQRRSSDVDGGSALATEDDAVLTPSLGPQRLQRASSTGGIFDLDGEEADPSEETQTTPKKKKPTTSAVKAASSSAGAEATSSSTAAAPAASTANRAGGPVSPEKRTSANFIDPFSLGFRQPSQPHLRTLQPSTSSSTSSSSSESSQVSPQKGAGHLSVQPSYVPPPASSLLAAPTPIPTAISPVTKHARGAFDSTPSFSSPLAYASTLPSDDQEQEQAEELDLDAPAAAAETVRATPVGIQSMLGAVEESMREQRSVSPTNTMAGTSFGLRRERSSSARGRLLAWDRQDASGMHKAVAASSSRLAPSSSSSSSLSSSSSVSSPIQARDTANTAAGPETPQSTSSASSSASVAQGAPGAQSKRKVSGIMGPPLSIPRKSSGGSSIRSVSGRDADNVIAMGGLGQSEEDSAISPLARHRSVTAAGSRQPSGGSEDNFHGFNIPTSGRSVSGSTTGGSSHSGDSPVMQQQPLSAHSLSHSSTGSTSPPSAWQGSMVAGTTGAGTGGPSQSSRKMRHSISSSSSSSSAHRRAKSLGGALLGDIATAIGGPDGVDPKLVAALRASDASMPSTPLKYEKHEPKLAAVGIQSGDPPPAKQRDAAYMVPSPRNASLPSTPSGTIRIPSSSVSTSGSAKKPELLNVLPDTRVLATSYPSVQMPPNNSSVGGKSTTGSDGSARISPTVQRAGLASSFSSSASPLPTPSSLSSSHSSSAVPEGYVRSRVRSQTTAAPLTSSTSPAPLQMATSLSRSNAPLGEAIRLQPMPSSVRNAGDIYTPSSPLISRHERRLSMAQPPQASQAQGLGIGGLTIPQTPNATRSPSPLGPMDAAVATTMGNASSTSTSTSAHSSPVIRPRRSVAESPWQRTSLSGSGSGHASGASSGPAPSPTPTPRETTDSVGVGKDERGNPLSVSIPNFRPDYRTPSSAMPALHYEGARGGHTMPLPSPEIASKALPPAAARTPAATDKFEVPDLDARYDPTARPAPWIASSQEVRSSRLGTTSRIARPGSSSGSGGAGGGIAVIDGSKATPQATAAASSSSHTQRTGGAATDSLRSSISTGLHRQGGIDEYARIIIQSRNAKMQKWRSATSKNQSSRYAGGPSSNEAEDLITRSSAAGMAASNQGSSNLLSSSIGAGGIMGMADHDTAWRKYEPRNSVTPNVSPAESLDEHSDGQAQHSMAANMGSEEIEWVDWLDEYRKMKEAKLLAEKRLGGGEEGDDDEGEDEVMADGEPPTSSSKDKEREAEKSPLSTFPSDLSRSLSSAMGFADQRSNNGPTSRPRRPSEMPTRMGRITQDFELRRSSSGLLPIHGEDDALTPWLTTANAPSASSAAAMHRRSMLMPEKTRNLSLSPITSRIASSGSQQSTTSTGRRKKLLGGKIEAWWGAVKTGFGAGLGTAPPLPPGASSPSSSSSSPQQAAMGSGRNFSGAGTTGAGGMGRRPVITPSSTSSDMHPMTATSGSPKRNYKRASIAPVFSSQSYNQSHTRAQTNLASVDTSQSVHTLRAASSTQNIKAQMPPATSSSSSHAPAAAATEKEQEEEDRAISPGASSQASESMQSQGQGGSRRRQPQLSLHFEKGQSSFDAGPFERMAPSKTTPSTGGRSSNVSRAIVGSSAASSPHVEADAANASSSPSPMDMNRAGPNAGPFAARGGGGTETSMSKTSSPSMSPENTRHHLSDAWHPSPPSTAAVAASHAAPAAEGEASSNVANASEESRGRSKHRKRDAGTAPSTSRDITFQSIREHIHARLAGSKESCDKELRKVVTAVNAFVEASILQREEEEEERQLERERERERAASLAASLALEGTAAATGGHGHGETSLDDSEGVFTVESTAPPYTSQAGEEVGSGLLLAPEGERSSSLATPKQVQDGSSDKAGHDYKLPKPPTLSQVQAAAAAAAAGSSTSAGSRLLMTHQALQRTRSRDVAGSRDTSRSHSPLPGAQLGTSLATPAESPQYSPARRIRPLPTEDAPLDPYIPALQDIVTIAVDVIDTSIHSLTVRPGTCSEIIARVQEVGKNWDEHVDWPGRGWYIQLLLAVAGLSRVVEWWEAEKGFWNFEGDDDDTHDAEPIRFIVKGGHGGGGQQGDGAGGAAHGETASHSPARIRSSVSMVGSSGTGFFPFAAGNNIMAMTSTPSAYSSGTSSPAMEPWDRRTMVTAEGGGERSRLATVHTQSPDAADLVEELEGDSHQSGRFAEAVSARFVARGEDGGGGGGGGGAAAAAAQEERRAGESANVLMELSLDGEHFLYLSPAWRKVIGSDPLTLFDRSISELLAAGDASTFAEATSQLQANDSHTVEAAFRLRIEHEAVAASLGRSQAEMYEFGEGTTFYQEMEGYGMLMHDRLSGMPSHTMWVFKPVSAPEAEADLSPSADKPSPPPASSLLTQPSEGSPPPAAAIAAAQHLDAAALASTTAYSMEPILCRICERDIPTGFFEKHSEICHEVHRLEMEVAEANEALGDLRRSSRAILAKLDEEGTPGAASGSSTNGEGSATLIPGSTTKEDGSVQEGGDSNKEHTVPEYRSVALSTPPASAARPSALEAVNRSLSPRHANPAAIRKMHMRALDSILDILRTASSISTPGAKDDMVITGDGGPIERQRLLSPESESKVVQVRNWRRPATGDDAALDLLCTDVESATRSKLSAVNRMLNTILYVETVRMEWESRVEAVLSSVAGPQVGESEGAASGASEGGEEDTSMDQRTEEEERSSSSINSSALGISEEDASRSEMDISMEDGERKVEDSGDASKDETIIMKSREPRTAEEQDEVDEVDASALLLEEPETPAANAAMSGGLSRRGGGGGAFAASDDEIPALEARMGGSSLNDLPDQHQAPIPIPTSSSRRSVAAAAASSPSYAAGPSRLSRQSSSDLLEGPLSGGSGNVFSPPLYAQPAQGVRHHQSRAHVPHSQSRRESVIASAAGERSLVQTPPMSPFQSPLEIGSVHHVDQQQQKKMNPANRRISVSHRLSPHMSSSMPLSPRMGPMAPSSRPTASTIKDFEIIKPISKGAFGSVFLAKKRTTGDYYAIKVLKKSDMIAKNQITNVKAERMILMTQTQSPFAVKLFFTFQSADYLYLVMEYLPGGDCSSLVKNLGGLSEEWAKQFMAEIVNGLDELHSKGIVHRDMKPDNLLIDQKGHLKLTDFGLSKIGLLGRQTRQQMATRGAGSTPGGDELHQRHDSASSSSALTNESGGGLLSSTSSAIPITPSSAAALDAHSSSMALSRFSVPETPVSNMAQTQTFYVGSLNHPEVRSRIMSVSTDASESSGSDSANRTRPTLVPGMATPLGSPSNLFGASMLPEAAFGSSGSSSNMASGRDNANNRPMTSAQQALAMTTSSGSGAQLKKFVGTPDYLAPESILGLGMDDAAVDWWALGVILYEFLYGYPPFHADTPEKVFDNILSRNIDWEEDIADISPEARDLMEGLMRTDRKTRLGTQGAEEIKRHPFFEGIDWEHLTDEEGPFVPQITDPESTDYFDLRGAVYQEFSGEVGGDHATTPARQTPGGGGASTGGDIRDFARAIDRRSHLMPSRPPSSRALRKRLDRVQTSGDQPAESEFGPFFYKNLPVLKEANDQILRKIRTEPMAGQSPASATSSDVLSSAPTGANLSGRDATATSAAPAQHGRHGSVSSKAGPMSAGTPTGFSTGSGSVRGPPSPSTSISSHNSSVPSRSTAPTSPSGLPFVHKGATSAAQAAAGLSHSKSLSRNSHYSHRRRPSELSSSANNVISMGSPSFSSMAAAAAASSSLYSGGGGGAASSALLDRKRSQLLADGGAQQEGSGGGGSEEMRRSSMPTRLRTTSMSAAPEGSSLLALPWQQPRFSASPQPQQGGSESQQEPATTMPDSADHASSSSPQQHTATHQLHPDEIQQTPSYSSTSVSACLIAEDNPIALKMLETILSKLGFGPMTCVRNGAEAVRLAMSDERFAILFVSVRLPIVNGQDVARMVKSTRNVNSVTPIVALVTPNSVPAAALLTDQQQQQQQQGDSPDGDAGLEKSFSSVGAVAGVSTPSVVGFDPATFDASQSIFDAILAKPVERTDVCALLPKLGFEEVVWSSSTQQQLLQQQQQQQRDNESAVAAEERRGSD